MKRFRLSTRLVVLVVLLQAVMLFLLAWNSMRLMGSSHAEIYNSTVRAEGRLLANLLASGLAFDDPEALKDVLSQLRGEQNIQYAVVRDRGDRVLASMGQPPPVWRFDKDYEEALSDGIYDLEMDVVLNGQKLGSLRLGYSLGDAAQIYQQTRWRNTFVVLVGMALTLGATFLLGMFLTRNLRKLEVGARALARDQLDHRIFLAGTDEIGEVAQAFNNLASHLGETQAELKAQHEALGRETRFLQTLLDGIDAVVMEARPPDFQFTYVSREAQNLLGFSVSEWAKPGFWSTRVVSEDLGWLEEAIAQHTAKLESFTVDFRMTHRQGHTLWVRAICNVESGAGDEPTLRGLLLDITEQKTAEERIVYLAEHDALTGLINRRRFQTELERATAYSQRYDQEGAILFIDLDQFKYVNDTYGHQYGDEYLLEVSRRLTRVLRRTDVLGRLGGDEFGVIIPKSSEEEAKTIGASLLSALDGDTLQQDGTEVPVSASIGVALFPTHSAVPVDLLARADAAMYTAKRQGRGQVHIFSDEDEELWNMQAKIHWDERIRWALAEDRFLLLYQPVANLKTGLITHYEALLRMKGDDGELIAPGAFIDTAERFGLIREIDQWVVQAVIRRQGESIVEGRPVSLAINLSGRHFGHGSMLECVREALNTFSADPGSLMFEVTETEAVENLSQARSFIGDLRGIGCRFALDDFGIGFSSFHYLRNLPVDYIKIDGSFVRNLHVDTDDRLFVKAIVDLARGLNIPCIAEFVENGHIVDVLSELGVELGQGYHLARPAETFIDGGFVKP